MGLSASLNRGEALGDRVLKVNHAGEHGAVNIYAAQIRVARLSAPDLVDTLEEFVAHERSHRALFEKALETRNIPRCRSYHLCAIGGFALGTFTAVLGRAAIEITTETIERTVLSHLRAQVVVLGPKDPEAAKLVSSIMEEEAEHMNVARTTGAASKIWRLLLAPVVAGSTEAVIWLGMHL